MLLWPSTGARATPTYYVVAEVVRRLDEQAWPTYLTQTDGTTALNGHIQAVQRRNDVWLG